MVGRRLSSADKSEVSQPRIDCMVGETEHTPWYVEETHQTTHKEGD